MIQSTDNPGVLAPPPLLYGGIFLVVLALQWLRPLPLLDHALWPGLALAGLSIGFGIWARRTMLAAGTNVDPRRPSMAIVTSGPFRLSRNPLYLALTVLYLGLTLAFNTWWGVVALVPLLIVMHFGVILREERYLEQKFGDSYRSYKNKVGRYLSVPASTGR